MDQCGPDPAPFSVLGQVYGVVALAVSSACQHYVRGKQEVSFSPAYLLPRVEIEQWYE